MFLGKARDITDVKREGWNEPPELWELPILDAKSLWSKLSYFIPN